MKVGELLRSVGKCTNTAERRPGFTLVFLIPLTADPSVQREVIGPGNAFQSGIRTVQRTVGADHESFTSLLWADGYGFTLFLLNGLYQGLTHNSLHDSKLFSLV